MKSLIVRSVMCIGILTLAVPPLPLFAQETKKPEEKKVGEDKPKVTEEMVVTARKKEETVQEVPFAVTAPSEERLRDVGAETIEDVAANVAGFSVQNLGPGQSQVTMRGVSAGQVVRDQPGVKEQVGVYLDESVISLSLFTPDVDLFDMNRIEVLRGPQGTLFGSGSLSGTVRYITNQPKIGVNESIGELTGSRISDGGFGGSIKAAVNVPFSPTSAMRFVGYYTKYGGFTDAIQPNLSVKKNVNNGNRYGARATFLFQPTTALKITPRLLYQKVDMHGWNRVDVFNVLGNPFTTSRPKVTLGPREIFTQIEEPFTDKFFLGDVKAEYDLGGKALTSVTSYTDRDVLVVRDASALTAAANVFLVHLPQSIATLSAPLNDATKAKVFTQEVRLSGRVPQLDWLVGGFYSHINRKYGQNLPVTGFTAASGIPTKGVFGAANDVEFFSDLRYKFKQFAIFGETTYAATDKLDLTGGLRWYDFKEDRTQVFDGLFSDAGRSAGSSKATGIAPRVMAGYKLTDATRLNAQISKGFRLGGINDPLNLPLCSPQDLVTFGGRPTWKDEELWNYEVGSKSRIMNNRGSLNVAAFYADIKNLQATLTAGTCSSRVVFNVPKARSAGVEAELEVAPNDAFDFALSASHTNSRLQSTLTSTDKNGVTSIVAGIKKGNRLPTVPEFQFAAASTFHWQMSQGMAGYLTGAYQHVGDRYTQIGDQRDGFGNINLVAFAPNLIGAPLTATTFHFDPKLPAYDIINLRVGVLKNRWDTALFVNNITDKRALLALDQELGSAARVSYMTNQPRTIGVSTRFNF